MAAAAKMPLRRLTAEFVSFSFRYSRSCRAARLDRLHRHGAADAHLLGGARDGRCVPVHVVREHGAGADELEDRKTRAGVDDLVGEVRLGGPDVLLQDRKSVV